MKTAPAVIRSTVLLTSIAVLVGIAGAQACGCSGSQGGAGSGTGFGQFVANAEACAKAEAQAIASGASVLDVANAVASVFAFAFASSPDLGTAETVIASLITKYGEPIVACAVVKGEAPPAAAGFGSGSDALRGASLSATLRRELAQKHGWQPQP